MATLKSVFSDLPYILLSGTGSLQFGWLVQESVAVLVTKGPLVKSGRSSGAIHYVQIRGDNLRNSRAIEQIVNEAGPVGTQAGSTLLTAGAEFMT